MEYKTSDIICMADDIGVYGKIERVFSTLGYEMTLYRKMNGILTLLSNGSVYAPSKIYCLAPDDIAFIIKMLE